MKLRIFLVMFFCFFLLASSSAAFDPAEVDVHPTLQKIYDDFFPPAVIKVTEGVYVARGYNRDNPVLIVGPSGLIVIDPGESAYAAEKVKSAFNSKLDNIFGKNPSKQLSTPIIMIATSMEPRSLPISIRKLSLMKI